MARSLVSVDQDGTDVKPKGLEDRLLSLMGGGGGGGGAGPAGPPGRGISSIVRTTGNGAAGTIDTYTITYSDTTTSTYQVRNGANGSDGNNGRGITSIARTSGNGAAGTVDTYTITFTDATTFQYQVRNGTDGGGGGDVSGKLDKSTTFTSPAATIGSGLRMVMAVNNVTSGVEPVSFETWFASNPVQTFWLNEAMTPRAQAVQPEPSFKLFQSYDTGYTGDIIQVLTRRAGTGSQRHLWSIDASGFPWIGHIQTSGSKRVKAAHSVIHIEGAALPDIADGTIVIVVPPA